MTVGVDIGTTSVKAVAVDASGRILERARLPHPLVVDAPDHLAHDADRAWRRGPRAALRRLGVTPAAIGICSMVPSLAPVDGRGRPIGPGLLYGDARGGGTDDFLPWLQASYPEAAGYWPAEAVAGHALRGTADVLAEGTIDVLCEQLVAGTEPGDVHVICGTTLLVWAVVAEERQVPGLWTFPGLRGDWVVGGASNAGGLFLEWVRRLHGPGRGPVDPDRVPVWVPYVRGERTPVHDPSRRAALHDLDLTHGPAAVARAAHEAAGFVVRHHLDLAGVRPRRVVATGGGTRSADWMQALADCTGIPVHVAAEPEGAALGAAYLARMALDGSGMEGAAAWARTGHVVEPSPPWVDAADARYARFRELVG